MSLARPLRRVPLLLFSSLVSLVPLPALATEASELSFSAGAQAFYGGLPNASDAVNPYGPGLGLRVGVTLPISLYFGISFEHFFGGEPIEWSNIVSVRSEASVDQVTGWGGYELPLDGVTLRPRLGLAYGRARTEDRVTELMGTGEQRRSTSEAAFALSPALELAFPVGAASFIVEGRYSFLPDALALSNALMLGVGFGLEI